MPQKGRGFGGPPSPAAGWQRLSGKPAAAPADPLAAAYLKAVELHRAGRLPEAYEAFTRVLAVNPKHPDANHGMGLLAHQTGNHEAAARFIGRAIEALSTKANYHSNLGIVLLALGRPAEAVESHRRALKRSPDAPEVLTNLGIALVELGRAEEAAQMHHRATVQRPTFAPGFANRGRALSALGRHKDAVISLEKALALHPDYLDAHVWLGDALARQDELEAAASSYRTALRINAHHAAGHLGLAEVLARAGKTEAAADNYRAAIYVQPTAPAYAGLARQLAKLGKPADASEAYRMALRLAPDDPAIAAELAALVPVAAGETAPSRELSELEREEAQYRVAISVTPDNAVAFNNLAGTLMSLGRLDEARSYYRKALERDPGYFAAWSELLFLDNYIGDRPVGELVAEAVAYGKAIDGAVTPRRNHANVADARRRLRVGLVSADLRRHPVGRFLEAVAASIDPSQIELVVYSTAKSSDEVTERMRKIIPQWHDAGQWDDTRLDEAIRADRIDILLDMSGHTAHNRLKVFAGKPAPIAATWLGYFATTGLEAIDYVLCNDWVVPIVEEDQWVEKPWRLPETYLCFTPPNVAVPMAQPPMLQNGYVTFGSANNINKLNDATARCWADVLKAVPASKLLLRSTHLADERVAEEVRARFGAFGIDGERLILEGARTDYADHLSQYNRVDIALDPFPYAGGTTTVEALWMGVPVLTLKGDRYVAHMGESILHNVGVPDWIAADVADYATKAATFAADATALKTLRQNLRHRLATSPLMDAPRFARNLETAFRQMWVKWCEEQGL